MYDPRFPLAHRADLPQHEREISAESLESLRIGIEQAKAGQLRLLTHFDDPAPLDGARDSYGETGT